MTNFGASDQIDRWRTLDVSARNIAKTKHFRDAQMVAQHAYELAIQTWGGDAPNTMASLQLLAIIDGELGYLSGATTRLRQVLAWRKATNRTQHIEYAALIHSLAKIRAKAWDIKEANQLLEDAGLLLFDLAADTDPLYLEIIITMIALDDLRGTCEHSLLRIEHLKELIAEIAPDGVRYHAEYYRHYGAYWERNGDEIKARWKFLRAIALIRQEVGCEDPMMSQLLWTYAGFCDHFGKFETGLEVMRSAINLDKRYDRIHHPDFPERLNTLSVLCGRCGLLQEAEKYCQQAVECFDQFGLAKGKVHVQLSRNLAERYLGTKPYESIRLLIEGLRILEDVEDNIELLAMQHNQIASFYQEFGIFDQAQRHLNLAIGYLNETGGIFPHYQLSIYETYGALCLNMDDPARALKIYELALTYLGKLSVQVPDSHMLILVDAIYASIETKQNELGANYLEMGDQLLLQNPEAFPIGSDELMHAQAKLLYQTGSRRQAYETLQKLLAKQIETHGKNSDYKTTLGSLVIVSTSQDETKAGINYLQEYAELSLSWLSNTLPYLSVTEKQLCFDRWSQFVDTCGSFCFSGDPIESIARELLFEILAAIRSNLLTRTRFFYRELAVKSTPQVKPTLERWFDLRSSIAALHANVGLNAQVDNVDIDHLEEQARLLEKKLATQLGTKWQLEDESASWQEIRSSLRIGEAAIQIVRIDNLAGPYEGEVIYAAYVIKADSEEMQFRLISSDPEFEFNHLASHKRNIASLRRGKDFEVYWRPLKEVLKNLERIYFCADGVYHEVCLNGLIDPDTGIELGAELEIVLVSSLNVLAQDRPLDFNLAKNSSALILRNPMSNTTHSGPTAMAIEQEVEEIQEVFSEHKVAYKARNLSVDAFAQGGDATIIHVAAHAYFADLQEVLAKGEWEDIDNHARRQPLLAAGIEMSRAPNTSKTRITAYEVASHYFGRCQLAVLAACETATGRYQRNQGLHGLTRAFQEAGAQAVIASLWKVPSNATRFLMQHFYQNLAGGVAINQAFRIAQTRTRQEFVYPYFWAGFVLIHN